MNRRKVRKDGLISKRITLPDGKIKDVYAHNESELTDKINAIQHDIDRGIVIGNSTTVDDWATAWIESYLPKLAPTTQAMYLNAYNKHIMPYLLPCRLNLSGRLTFRR